MNLYAQTVKESLNQNKDLQHIAELVKINDININTVIDAYRYLF